MALIAIEGVDGSGKSGLCRWIKEHAATVFPNRELLTSYEPTHREHGAKLRHAMVPENGVALSSDEELELFFLDREDHVENVIRPALAEGKVVLLDRYFYSNIAYQGARGYSKELILQRNLMIAPRPDLLLIIDIPVDEALKRIEKRGGGVTVFEKKPMLKKVRDTFLSFDGEPHVKVVSGLGTPREVIERAVQAIWKSLPART